MIESASEQPAVGSGAEHRAFGIHDLGRFGHEVHPAHHDHRRVRFARLDGQSERVADKVGGVLNFGDLVVVGQDDRVVLARQAAHRIV